MTLLEFLLMLNELRVELAVELAMELAAMELAFELLLELALVVSPLPPLLAPPAVESSWLLAMFEVSTEEAIEECWAESRIIGGCFLRSLFGLRKYMKEVMTGHTRSHPMQIWYACLL